MTKWPVQKLAQGTTQKLLQHILKHIYRNANMHCVLQDSLFLRYLITNVFYLQQICKVLMHQAMQDMARCEGHVGDQWMGCGTSTVDGVCNVCCADGGCNYGTCEEIRGKNI